jgi:surface protein
MSRFRCFDTYNLQNTSSSDHTTNVRRQTIFTEYQTIAIGNVNFQKGLTEGVIPPGYLRKDNGAYYYGPVYVTTDDPAVNNCLIGAKNYKLLYDVLFAAQPSPDEIKNTPVSFDGSNWQGNILKTTYKTVPNAKIGPAIINIPDGSLNKMNYATRQDFLPKYDEKSPPESFPGMIIDPCYNIFYPRCNTSDQANNYVKNISFNFTSAQLENTELINYLRLSTARNYKAFPYPLNFQNTTCQKYPFSFVFSFINQSGENAEQISLKYMPIINIDNTISYSVDYDINGSVLKYYINFKYTGAPSNRDGLSFYDPSSVLVNFYNNKTTNLTIEKFNLIPLSPIGNQFKGLIFTIAGTDIPIIKPLTSLNDAFRGSNITLNGDGISNWRTAGVVSMNSTFRDSNFNGELNDWNTSNVTDMVSTFENATSFNQPIEGWNISNVTNMSRMFYGAILFNQDINNWNTSSVTFMTNLFSYASSFDQSLNNWNTANVVDMSGLFLNAESFNGDIHTWNTQRVLTMHSMFKNAYNFNKNIAYNKINDTTTYWNTVNVTTFDGLFENTVKFNNGYTPLPSINADRTHPLDWKLRIPVPSQIDSVTNAIGLTRENAYPFILDYIFSYSFYDNGTSTDISVNSTTIEPYLPIILGGSTIDNIIVTPDASSVPISRRKVSFKLNYTDKENTGISFYDIANEKINFYNNIGSNNKIYILNFDSIGLAKNGSQFQGLYNLDISYTSSNPSILNNTSLSNAFNGATNFNSNMIDNWNVENAINMSGMFKDISFNQDISGWNTINVTDMSSMFENNINFNQDISKWNTSKVIDMSNMFKNASVFNSKLQYDPSKNYWDVSSVLNMTSMFENATNFNDGQDPSGITQPLDWILNPNVNLNNVRTGAINLTNENAYPLPSFYTLIYEFWNKMATLVEISNNIPFIISSPSSVIYTTVYPPTDTSGEYKTVNVTTSYPNHIQDLSSGISFIDVSGFFNENNDTSMHSLFIRQFGGTPLASSNLLGDGYQFAGIQHCNFVSPDLPTILPNTTLSFCFYNTNFNCDLSGLNTSTVVSMKSMFENSIVDCSMVWNTNKVIDMSSMFKNNPVFNQQISYTGGQIWDVSSVLNMSNMFEGALNFNNGQAQGGITQPLSWNLNPNVNLNYIRYNCPLLTNQNASPLPPIYELVYTFYDSASTPNDDISNNYLPLIINSPSYNYKPTILNNNPSIGYKQVSVVITIPSSDVGTNTGLSFYDISTNKVNFYNTQGNNNKISILQFNGIPLSIHNGTTNKNGYQFAGLRNLEIVSNTFPTILPDTSLNYAFYNTYNNTSDISGWDVSGVITMASMFKDSSFNNPLENWNVEKVRDMSYMFNNNNLFNQNISEWKTNRLSNMEGMFKNTQQFNSYLGYDSINGYWDVSSVLNMISIFEGDLSFNNGYPPGNDTNPLDWILNLNVNTTNCIENTPSLTFENAYPLSQLRNTFEYTFFNTENLNLSPTDISNLYLPIKSTNNLTYYRVPTITINPLINNLTTVTVYYKYNNISLASSDGLTFIDVSGVYNINSLAKTITKFGSIPISRSNGYQFSNINNLIFNTQDTPTINYNTTFQNIFYNSTFNSDISGWDTSGVISMNSAFRNSQFNNILNTWNTHNVIDMSGMFYNCSTFNTPISNWDVSNVQKMTRMFYGCNNFNQDISGWKTTKLTDMTGMFQLCQNFNKYLSKWDVSSVLSFSNCFNNSLLFNNGDVIGQSNNPLYWNTKSATNMSYLFYNANSFNQDISGWNTSNVTNMSNMFNSADVFNRPIDKWNVQNVNDMSYMFANSQFNQDISGWNTNGLKYMNHMFYNDISYNQITSYNPLNSLNIWDTSGVNDFTSVFEGALTFNNGQVPGSEDLSLNWTLDINAVITNAVLNTPLLTQVNAEPFNKNITGAFTYSFYNYSDISDASIINNYLPIIDVCNNLILTFPPSITHPLLSDPSFSLVQIYFSFVPDANTIDGLSFYSAGNTKTNFYNSTGKSVTILNFNSIPISRINQVGTGYQFANLSHLDISVNSGDTPIISAGTTFDHAFYNTPNFNSGNIGNWDTLFVNNMASMFQDSSFNKPLRFNTINVTNMNSMFKNASNFNQNLQAASNIWNVSNVTDMTSMFENAISFNNGIAPYPWPISYSGGTQNLNWNLNASVDISNVRRNTPVFDNSNAYPLPALHTLKYNFYDNVGESESNIINNYAPIELYGKSSFYDYSVTPSTATIGNKSVSIQLAYIPNGTTFDPSNTGLTFYSAGNTKTNFYNNNNNVTLTITQFDAIPLSKNNTAGYGYQFANLNRLDFSANVVSNPYAIVNIPEIINNTNLSYCFYNSTYFNSDISGWNTLGVINMESLFEGDSSFNSPLESWNTTNVTNMSKMFKNAKDFNKRISYIVGPPIYWSVNNVTNMSNMFEGALNFNNGQPAGGTTQPLNWNLKTGVNLNYIRYNCPLLTNQNASPLPPIYELVYTFYNSASTPNDDISNNYLPLIINSPSYNYKPTILNDTPFVGYKQVSVVLTVDNNDTGNTGLSFNAPSNNKVIFYNNQGDNNPITFTKFDMIPLAINDFQFGYLQNLVINPVNPIDKPTIKPNTSLDACFIFSVSFNSDISGWDTSQVINMRNMFRGTSFNKPLNTWNTGNVTVFEYMFLNNTAFNQDISGWNTANAITMSGMFQGATSFNQPINNWNTGNVIFMSGMFQGATSFNQPINNWNISNVIYMDNMFNSATSFNQPINTWNTSNVIDMSSMFYGATNFNQTIKYVPASNYWNVSAVTNMSEMFYNANNFNNGFPPYNYDNSLNWVLNPAVITTNAVTNTPVLTDYNGLPLTNPSYNNIYYPNQFIYTFNNTNNASIQNILFNYLPFTTTGGQLILDISRNVNVSGATTFKTVYVRFKFTDNGSTNDGLNFNANKNIAYFYNQTLQPVNIIQFDGMPLSRSSSLS